MEAGNDAQASLAELGPDALAHWSEAGGLSTVDPTAARQLLRNPYVTAEILGAVSQEGRLMASYELRRDLVAHPRTPQIRALHFVGSLRWRELMILGLDARVPPMVRRSADQQLVGRLPGLAVGERMSIARRASQGVLMAVRFDQDTRVIAALFTNPRLTQGLLMPLAASSSAPPEILRLVAENQRWGVLYAVRQALVKNPRTPPAVAVAILPNLKRADRQAVALDPRLPQVVRQVAKTSLGGDLGPANRHRS